MDAGRKLRLGALGGPNTFGGDAANQLLGSYPEFEREVQYFRTAEDGLAFAAGGHDAMCAPQQMARTGFHALMNQQLSAPDSRLYIVADVTHFYHCSLLLKPGAVLRDVREVRGHTGSITQSRTWIESHLPNAQIRVVDTSSHEAAREVTQGDGSIASVGTPGMARQFGLVEAAKDIDGGSNANYWAISPHARFAQNPNRVFVSGRFDERGQVGRIVASLQRVGFELRSVFADPTGLRLYEYDHNLWFGGSGTLAAVQEAVGACAGARLSGAYLSRG